VSGDGVSKLFEFSVDRPLPQRRLRGERIEEDVDVL
jgi:hypothetical protein